MDQTAPGITDKLRELGELQQCPGRDVWRWEVLSQLKQFPLFPQNFSLVSIL